ncbi:PREDICTED: uncharacterized protein LOC105360057 [Ceratosolen solmsi marchali]|uniref:Uncharacterized protein LOC105360057 n=1 Tax=Ceratosolen solmsi marchali TaxID=326594 RepID=A0AAJ6VM68_9HYME|nr:PREDICTED: uncharacterized protein LOC105360057 [Ceratosolen solmsi marchali]
MRSGGTKKIVTDHTIISERKARKSLHLLQPAATDKENLVGAGRHLRSLSTSKQIIKNEISDMMKEDINKIFNKTVLVKRDSCKKVIDKHNIECKKLQNDCKMLNDKYVQTESNEQIEIFNKDLSSKLGPSENYWELLAERRRIALHDALAENHILTDQICIYKEMLDEARALVEVLKDMLGNDKSNINISFEDRH